MGLELFLLGPVAGVAVGLLGIATLDLVRRRVGMRRDYESLYSLGLAFAAYAAAESMHGSGFFAAFAAGMTISTLDVELCDCFQEYGETTAELALLFTFVLLGSSLIWTGLAVVDIRVTVFAVIALLVRPLVLLASLIPTGLDRKSMALIAWFGPRGLSSLLLVLLPVFAGIPGSAHLFSLCSVVVLTSVLLHGGSVMVVGRRGAPAPPSPPIPAQDVSPPKAAAPENGHPTSERISVADLQALREAGQPVVVLDARSQRSLEASDATAGGSIRLDPERPVHEAERLGLPKEAWLVAFCA
jgi:NhaP-type Na+/H+ or K+/H+ antiporter